MCNDIYYKKRQLSTSTPSTEVISVDEPPETWVDTEVPKCQTTVQANSLSIYVYIDILFACFGSFALRDFGINPETFAPPCFIDSSNF